jgi:hypothetical protein
MAKKIVDNKNEILESQIKSYNLKNKLNELAKNDEKQRPFRHLPKQFSKGILIGNIAIVPKKIDPTRYVYVIADMTQAKILYDSIFLKQTAILVAHYLADQKNIPDQILTLDEQFASKLFDIKNFKRFYKIAIKENDDDKEFVYSNKLIETNRRADEIKLEIHQIFDHTFRILSDYK